MKNLKKTRQDTLVLFLISLFVILFGSFSNYPNDGGDITISGYVQINVPYEGGAAPPPELENGYFYDGKNIELYFVKKGDNSKTSIAKIITDTLGKFSIQLPPGDYCIFQSQKMMDYNELLEQFNPSEFYPVPEGEDPCLKQWHNTPDLCFSSIIDTFVYIILPTGNPCSQSNVPDHP
ncbi:MAG: hypothetical protein Kow0068_25660 [Marinilabiliales bacterium]